MSSPLLITYSLTLTADRALWDSLAQATDVWQQSGRRVVWISLDPLGGSGEPIPGVVWLRLGEPALAIPGLRQVVAQTAKLLPALAVLGACELQPWGVGAKPAASLAAWALGLHLGKDIGPPDVPINHHSQFFAKRWRARVLHLLAACLGPGRARRITAERTDTGGLLAALIDVAHYSEQCSPLANKDSAIQHFLAAGQYAGHSPHLLFWTRWYADRYLLGTGGVCAWRHFIDHGLRGGCAPNPFLTPLWYEKQPGAGQYHTNPLLDYAGHLQAGSLAPDPNPLFDQRWYMEVYRTGHVSPMIHFLNGNASLPTCPFLARHPELEFASERADGGYVRRFSNAFINGPSLFPGVRSLPAGAESCGRVAVCCVLTGNYDRVPVLLHRDFGTDYFLLTDHLPDEPAVGWQAIIVAPAGLDPQCHSRSMKMQLLRYVPNAESYALFVYVDGNVQLVGSLLPLLENFAVSDAPLGVVPHPFRRCVYEEAAAVLIQLRDSRENVLQTVDFLESAGHPPGWGLFEMNFFCFRPGLRAKSFFARWWSLYQRFGRRDQLLAPFVAREQNLQLHALLPPGESVRTHSAFHFLSHRI